MIPFYFLAQSYQHRLLLQPIVVFFVSLVQSIISYSNCSPLKQLLSRCFLQPSSPCKHGKTLAKGMETVSICFSSICDIADLIGLTLNSQRWKRNLVYSSITMITYVGIYDARSQYDVSAMQNATLTQRNVQLT